MAKKRETGRRLAAEIRIRRSSHWFSPCLRVVTNFTCIRSLYALDRMWLLSDKTAVCTAWVVVRAIPSSYAQQQTSNQDFWGGG